jgi:hypothetical protein
VPAAGAGGCRGVRSAGGAGDRQRGRRAGAASRASPARDRGGGARAAAGAAIRVAARAANSVANSVARRLADRRGGECARRPALGALACILLLAPLGLATAAGLLGPGGGTLHNVLAGICFVLLAVAARPASNRVGIDSH